MSVRIREVRVSRGERRRLEREVAATTPDGLTGTGRRTAPWCSRPYRVREPGPLPSLDRFERESDEARAEITSGVVEVDP